MRIYRYIGVAHTALVLKSASRINALQDVSALPATNYSTCDTSNGNKVDCGNNRNDILLIVTNLHASNALTVTQTTYATVAGIVVPNEATVVAALKTAIIGPINHNSMLSSDVAEFAYSGTAMTGKCMALKVVANDA